MSGVAVRVRVSRSGRAGAFSWPDGTVELTSDLVERLDEDELAAAIAHELGHIIEGRPRGAASALSGRSGSPDDAEARADRFATRLLARAGYDPSAMSRTLTKVMNTPGMTPACRARLADRIALLTTALRRTPLRPLSPCGRGLG
jgi:predicted Zn-dependent protease